MSIENLKQLIELANMLDGETSPKKKEMIGEFVIVRCRDAGVHAGILVDYEGRTVILKDSRRLWYWKAAQGHTLSAVAEFGITDESKVPVSVARVVLPEAAEIISTTEKAQKSIMEIHPHEVD